MNRKNNISGRLSNIATQSPLFYFDSNKLSQRAKQYSHRKFKLYYSVKASLFKGLATLLHPLVDGFSVSSITELENTKAETSRPIHFVSPLIRETEINLINHFANSITFNSLEQIERLKHLVAHHINIFLRVNPEISFIKDKRYDPCRPYSKLGIPLKDLKQYLLQNKEHRIKGIHFHNACQSKNINNITKVLEKIKYFLGDYICKLPYINIGGGYLYSKDNFTQLQKLNKAYNNKLIIEPGFDLVNSSGYLISSVTDIFTRQNKSIAVLDTSTNHLPEVFEYNIKPDILNSEKNNKKYSFILAGASCLAGDIFGEYAFRKPLQIGSQVIFKNVGAYSIVKAHKFNGLQIPKVVIMPHSIKTFLDKSKNILTYNDLTL